MTSLSFFVPEVRLPQVLNGFGAGDKIYPAENSANGF